MVAPSMFAQLAGRPTDATLSTFVKKGAYYSEQVDAKTLFTCNREDDLVRFFKREGVGIMICDFVMIKYKPSTSDLILSGVGEIHVG